MQITKQEFDEVFKSNDNVEIFTQKYIDNYIESNMELLQKSEKGEDLEDFEKSELNTVTENIQSFQKVEVFGREKDQYDIQKSIYYIREKQVEWDEIEKSEDPEIMKSRGGVYKNTALNRKMGRVGQKFGGSGSKEDEKKDSSNKLGDVPWDSTSFGSLKEGGYGLTFNTKEGKKSVKVEGKDVEKLTSGTKEEKQKLKLDYFNKKGEETKKTSFRDNWDKIDDPYEIPKTKEALDAKIKEFESELSSAKKQRPSNPTEIGHFEQILKKLKSSNKEGEDGKGKSKEASMVLKIMDNQEEPSYSKALKEVLDKTGADKKKLEKELEKYI